MTGISLFDAEAGAKRRSLADAYYTSGVPESVQHQTERAAELMSRAPAKGGD